MKRLLFWKNGLTAVAGKGISLSYHGEGDPTMELDITLATDDEIEKLKKNPHDNQLVQTIQQRKKAV